MYLRSVWESNDVDFYESEMMYRFVRSVLVNTTKKNYGFDIILTVFLSSLRTEGVNYKYSNYYIIRIF